MKPHNLIQLILELYIDQHQEEAGRFTNWGEGTSSGLITDRSGFSFWLESEDFQILP